MPTEITGYIFPKTVTLAMLFYNMPIYLSFHVSDLAAFSKPRKVPPEPVTQLLPELEPVTVGVQPAATVF